MSLLLDALKKAEKAKDDAKRRAQMAAGSDVDEPNHQVRTRNELPDISRPLEFHSEDIPGGAQPGAPGTARSLCAFQLCPAERKLFLTG